MFEENFEQKEMKKGPYHEFIYPQSRIKKIGFSGKRKGKETDLRKVVTVHHFVKEI